MGNDLGKGTAKMAIAAMSNVTNFEKKELFALRAKFKSLADREGNASNISRTDFREAIEEVGVVESDAEILERLFTMLDKTGDEQVNYREYLVGIAPMITGDVSEKITFVFDLYDVDSVGVLKAAELSFILTSMNNVSSYFGDPVMSSENIEELVEDVYRENDLQGRGQLSSVDLVAPVIEHNLFVQFTEGKGTVRYGMGK